MATKSAVKPTKSKPTKSTTAKAAAKSSTSAKRSSTKAAITKPVAAAKSVTAIKMVKPDVKTGSVGEINKRELVERVMSHSDMKKGDARRAVDAVLGAMGAALREGKDIAAAPLGKVKIVRKKETPNGELAVLRVKLKDPNKVQASTAEPIGLAKAQK